MRWILSMAAVLAVTSFAFAAPPTKAEITKAHDKVKWTSNASEGKYKGKTVTFHPADISGYNNDEIDKGIVLGKLEVPVQSKGGLAPGTYIIYVRRFVGAWQVYFTQKDEPTAFSKSVEATDHDAHQPEWLKNGTVIHYWKLQFEW